MTNEEKARELAKKIDWNAFIANDYTLKKCIEEAMQWKDEQYNEEKRDLLGLVKMLKIDEHNQTIIEDLVAILNS